VDWLKCPAGAAFAGMANWALGACDPGCRQVQSVRHSVRLEHGFSVNFAVTELTPIHAKNAR
jgi:hypothetical protein